MYAMVLESAPGAADPAVDALNAAGWTVSRCQESDRAPFPCNGILDPERCPLARRVDVAVLVRADGDPAPTAREAGVTCAVRAGVPLVQDAKEAVTPFDGWMTAKVIGGDVVEACRRAVATHRSRLAGVVVAAIAPTLERAGVAPTSVRCWIHEAPAGLHLEIAGPFPTDITGMIAVRAMTALPRALRGAEQLDITVTSWR